MHPALIRLLKLEIYAFFRRMFRSAKTLKGAAFMLLGVGMLCLWVGPSLLFAFTEDRAAPETPRAVAPLIMLVICVLHVTTSACEKAMYFQPSEVNFLFAAPFSRRQLLLYKLTTGSLASLFIAAFISVFLLRTATWWITVYFGVLLTLLFFQYLGVAVVMIREIISEHLYSTARKLLIAVVAVFLGVALWESISLVGWENLLKSILGLRETWAGLVLLAPFEVFSRTIFAQTLFPEFVGWSALAVCVDLLVLAVVIRLDANYLEAAMGISQKIYSKVQQARRGGGAMTVNRRAAKRRFPMLPFFSGAGPIAWRQLVTALRNSTGSLVFMFIIVISIAPTIIIAGLKTDKPLPDEMAWLPVGLAAWMSLWFTAMVPFDFKGDLDRMEWLKMLPASSMAVTLGQLATPILIFSLLEILLFSALGIFIENWRAILLPALLFVIPFNLLHFGIDNLIFLIFPTRMGKATPGDFQMFGRQMLIFIIKILAVLLVCGVAAGLGFLCYWFLSIWSLAVVITWLVVLAASVLIVPYVAWSFEAFDVSSDIPA